MISLNVFMCMAAFVFFGVFYYIKRCYQYWEDRGIPFIKPKFPNGNISGLGETEHFLEMMSRFYFELKSKGKIFGGAYFTITPVVIAVDLDFVKTILVKDFEYFHDRGFYVNERDDPLMANLITMEGHEWKSLRSRISPTFTTRRIKSLIPIITNIAEKFVLYLKKDLANKEDINLRDYMPRYTIDIIANCGFGLNSDSLNNPNVEFLAMANEASNILVARTIRSIFMTSFKKLSKFLRLKLIRKEMTEYYKRIIVDTMKYREQNNVHRDDFLDMLTQLKNKGQLNDDDTRTGKVVDNEIIANSFLLIIAGFHTSASTMEFCLQELAQNIGIQDKLRKEIMNVLEEHNNEITYEAISAMKYLDKVLHETLRKHPPGGNIVRSLRKNYKVPEMDLILEKGTQVFISVHGIHRDPDIYADPEKFDPERFSPEAIKMRHSLAFLSFGDGPRNCIGFRFALASTKIGIITLLLNYKFSPCAKTTYPIKYMKHSGILRSLEDVWLKIEKI